MNDEKTQKQTAEPMRLADLLKDARPPADHPEHPRSYADGDTPVNTVAQDTSDETLRDDLTELQDAEHTPEDVLYGDAETDFDREYFDNEDEHEYYDSNDKAKYFDDK